MFIYPEQIVFFFGDIQHSLSKHIQVARDLLFEGLTCYGAFPSDFRCLVNHLFCGEYVHLINMWLECALGCVCIHTYIYIYIYIHTDIHMNTYAQQRELTNHAYATFCILARSEGPGTCGDSLVVGGDTRESNWWIEKCGNLRVLL